MDGWMDGWMDGTEIESLARLSFNGLATTDPLSTTTPVTTTTRLIRAPGSAPIEYQLID